VGSGTRLKIFEAMAMGRAVVSTTIGAEGLPVTHSNDIVLADEPASFADAVCRLMESPDERTRIGNAARKLVAENYSWGSVARQVETVLRAAAAKNSNFSS
jgi:glycosyltransferase involved in cell wall biosynthesis